MGHLALGRWQVARLASHQDASRATKEGAHPANLQGWDNAGRPSGQGHPQVRYRQTKGAQSCRAELEVFSQPSFSRAL